MIQCFLVEFVRQTHFRDDMKAGVACVELCREIGNSAPLALSVSAK